MPTFRTGLLLATLFLSACSMPILQDLQQDKPETAVRKNNQSEPIPTTKTEIPVEKINDGSQSKTHSQKNNDSHNVSLNNDRIEQFNDQKRLANANFAELKNRTGKAAEMPKAVAPEQLNAKELNTAIQQLRTYISKTNTEIASLNARVNDRQKVMMNGDIIQIFLSEATVSHDKVTFKAQPLVGQWVRGESRVIRLKDNILFESPMSEDLNITFSEAYQLVINGKVISTINPNKEKNNASFNVSTHNNSGNIIGKLDYRIVNSKS
jgi:hypothetical protein